MSLPNICSCSWGDPIFVSSIRMQKLQDGTQRTQPFPTDSRGGVKYTEARYKHPTRLKCCAVSQRDGPALSCQQRRWNSQAWQMWEWDSICGMHLKGIGCEINAAFDI